MDKIEKKKEALEYYKKIFTKRITDFITLDVDENGQFYPDFYWLLENMVVFHEIACKICEPKVEFKFNWYFKFFFDFLKEILVKKNKFLIINVPPGHGKCLKKGTMIRMYDGSKKAVENIAEGELIMGDDSSPRTVLNTARGKEEMFKITCQDGSSFSCNGSHILVLENISDNTKEKFSSKETLISVFDYLKTSDYFKKRNKLKKAKVFYKEKELSIDPYILGCWLGNKNLTRIEQNNFRISENCSYIPANKKNCFLSQLVQYDLLNNKHIPEDFLINNEKNRLELFAGLIDSSGIINKKNNSLEFLNKNELLINNIMELARSLGFFAKKYKKTIKKEIYFRLKIIGDFNLVPCLCEEKKSVKKLSNKKNPLLQNFKVESLGIGDYYGFELDGNHKFLLEDFTISHNTTSLISFICLYIGFFPHTRILIISGADTVRNKYVKNIKEILNSEYYQQLFPGVKIDKNEKNTEEMFFLEKFNYKGETEGGGSVTIKTMQGNITGTDSDFTVFDDPNDFVRYKTEKESYLTKMNEIVGSCITRDRGTLGNEAPFLLCMQRIAENDSTGYLLKLPNAKKWKHINIPAKIENGTDAYYNKQQGKVLYGKYFNSPYRTWFIKNGNYIFPDSLDDERFELKRSLINNDIDFQWQYFQECKDEDTKIFHINCINYYEKDSINDISFEKVVVSIDSSNGENDYQSMQLWGFTTFENNITKRKEIRSYLLDVYLSQEKTPIFMEKVINWYVDYNPDYILVEEKSSGYEIINSLEIMEYGGMLSKKDALKNKKIVCINPKMSKEDRARSASVEINSSRVFFPKNFEKTTTLDKKKIYVIKELERELNVFPSKNDMVHDDGVDALTQALNWARVYFNRNKQRRINISYV